MEIYYEDPVERKKQELYNRVDFNTENQIFQGFEFDSKIFSLSISAQINWSNLFFIPDGVWPLNISCKDETSYSLSLSNRSAFYGAALNAKNSALQAGNTLKAEIRACTTLEQLQEIESGL